MCVRVCVCVCVCVCVFVCAKVLPAQPGAGRVGTFGFQWTNCFLPGILGIPRCIFRGTRARSLGCPPPQPDELYLMRGVVYAGPSVTVSQVACYHPLSLLV